MRLAQQLLAGLAHAHEQGIVHRDLKPENLILSEEAGLKEHLRILDFGLAKLRDGPQMTAGMAVGHAQLHVARAVGRGRRDRRAHGSVHGRHRAVRDVRRAQAVPVRERRRGDPDAARDAAAQAARGRRRMRAIRWSWRRCSTRRCRSCPRIDSSRRPSWPPRWPRRRRGRRRARRSASWPFRPRPRPTRRTRRRPRAEGRREGRPTRRTASRTKARTRRKGRQARAGRDGPPGRQDDDRHGVGGPAAAGSERRRRGRGAQPVRQFRLAWIGALFVVVALLALLIGRGLRHGGGDATGTAARPSTAAATAAAVAAVAGRRARRATARRWNRRGRWSRAARSIPRSRS